MGGVCRTLGGGGGRMLWGGVLGWYGGGGVQGDAGCSQDAVGCVCGWEGRCRTLCGVCVWGGGGGCRTMCGVCVWGGGVQRGGGGCWGGVQGGVRDVHVQR